MQNMEMRLEGDKLVIEVDMSKDFGPSKSGKTIVVASSRGNADIPGKDGYKIGLNIYKYANPK